MATTVTFNPVAGGTRAIRGRGSGDTYNNVWDNLGSTVLGLGDATDMNMVNGYTAGEYELWRGFFSYDTSSLPNNAIILSAFSRIYVVSKVDFASDSLHITTSTASATSISTSDYGNLGTVTKGSKTVASLTTSANNQIDFSDLTLISKTGHTTFGHRVGREMSKTSPTTSNNKTEIISNGTTGANPSLLSVTYTLSGGNIMSFSTGGVTVS